MKGADGYVQAYDCQVAVDAESHVIVAQLASPNAADQIQLEPIVAQIKSNTGRQAKELSADAGYCTEDNSSALMRSGSGRTTNAATIFRRTVAVRRELIGDCPGPGAHATSRRVLPGQAPNAA